MRIFQELERRCSERFIAAGKCWHVWTPESYELIFSEIIDYKVAMFVIGLAMAMFPEVKLITFQVMSNHLHLTMAGPENQVLACFGQIRSYLSGYFDKTGRRGLLKGLECKHFLSHIPGVQTVSIFRPWQCGTMNNVKSQFRFANEEALFARMSLTR